MEKEFLGLSKKAAQDKADQKNLIFYLLRIDENTYLPFPEDSRSDRVCIEIDKGYVSNVILQ